MCFVVVDAGCCYLLLLVFVIICFVCAVLYDSLLLLALALVVCRFMIDVFWLLFVCLVCFVCFFVLVDVVCCCLLYHVYIVYVRVLFCLNVFLLVLLRLPVVAVVPGVLSYVCLVRD